MGVSTLPSVIDAAGRVTALDYCKAGIPFWSSRVGLYIPTRIAP